MRVLIVHPGPDFSVADVHRGWYEAFRELGVEVMSYNTNDRLIFYSKALMPLDEEDETGHPIVKQAMTQDEAFDAAMAGLTDVCYTFWPNVILFISAFFMKAKMFSLLRARGHKLVVLNTESPYQDEAQLIRGQLAHLNLLNDPTNIERFRKVTPTEYMAHAYRPKVHHPRTGALNPHLAADLTFVGTAFRSRIEFFEAMDLDGLDVLLGGNDWGTLAADSPLVRFLGHDPGDPGDCVDNSEAAELYRHAKTGLNFYRREAEEEHEGQPGWAMGPREVEMAACGLFFLRDPRPEGDQVFRDILPTFDSPGDASEKLRWWLAHDSLREKRAAQAREAVADRTFVNNARRLLKLLDM